MNFQTPDRGMETQYRVDLAGHDRKNVPAIPRNFLTSLIF